MKKLFLIVVICAVVLASGCTQSQETEPQPDTQTSEQAPENEDDSENTIVFTGNGFQPSDLTIEQGETVTWVSEASSSMWVASDRHPSHTNYAGSSLGEHCENGDQTEAAFDQCSTGDQFSFTFEKTGEWSYHNHEPFVQGGTITVE